MDVYWLEQRITDLPTQNDWLSARERAQFELMRFEKRRSDWRLGRWAAKNAVAAYLRLTADFCTLATLVIQPAETGAPEVFLLDKPAKVSISLSHRSGVAMCAVAAPGMALGCDVETVEAHSQGFVADFFTEQEQQFVRDSPDRRDLLITLFWSAKESVSKALREGLKIDTRTLNVQLPISVSDLENKKAGNPESCTLWREIYVTCGHQLFQGLWREEDSMIRTMLASFTFVPIHLTCPDSFSRKCETGRTLAIR